jgi:pyrroloquinoline quinone biosynthesis protein D
MSRARGRRRVRLAQGIRLEGDKGDEAKDGVMVLLSPNGPVQLNRTAAAILRLCDGSRDREGIVAEVGRRSNPHTRPAEIIEFLDAARARGWIDET